jgi:ribosome-binding factor A
MNIERVNELLREKLASLISREISLDNGLITVVYVICSPDLKYAKIGVSVLPIHAAGSTLKKLNQHNSIFSQIIRKETRLRQIPKFTWAIDSTEEHAQKIEELIKESQVPIILT